MSIDDNLNKYNQARKLLQEIINSNVKNKENIIEELEGDLKDKPDNTPQKPLSGRPYDSTKVCPNYNQLVSECKGRLKCNKECGRDE